MRFALPVRSRGLFRFLPSALIFSIYINGLAISAFSGSAHAQTIPGPADIGRIAPEQERNLPENAPDDNSIVPSFAAPTAMPEGAEEVRFVLEDLLIEGVTAFTPEQLAPIYSDYIGEEISLDRIYGIAADLTALYRSEGYFLSLAYVPDQNIDGGVVRIRVVEGHIGVVDGNPFILQSRVVDSYIKNLLQQDPLKSDAMESFLLRINDLPGYAFRAVLSPMPEAEEGAVKLTLVPGEESGRGQIGFDNFSSRFLGPNQFSAFYEKSFIPLHETSISGLAGLPLSKLHYVTLGHSVVVAPDLKLNLSGNITRSEPGYTLKPLEIESRSDYLGAGLEWQYIRQRTENMSFSVMFDRRNTNTDFLDTPFTRDRVRALRFSTNYDTEDSYNGYNWAGFTLSRGLSVMGASEEGDDNLSREDAKPEFTKLEASYTRVQSLPHDLSLVGRAAGQIASGALYSSEEFGYGGQSFGRAYDASEITGDHGVSASLELQYGGIDTGEDVRLSPYVFYDIGRVWNEDDGQAKRESGASAGFGTRVETSLGISFNGGVAFPLTRSVETPIYGGDEGDPRLFLQITKDF